VLHIALLFLLIPTPGDFGLYACCLSTKLVSGRLSPLFIPTLLLSATSPTENSFAADVEVRDIEIGRSPFMIRVFCTRDFKRLPVLESVVACVALRLGLGRKRSA